MDDQGLKNEKFKDIFEGKLLFIIKLFYIQGVSKKTRISELGVWGPLKPCCAFPYYLAHLYRIQGYV